MAALWTLAPIRGAVILEYGCMGHVLYSRTALNRAGIADPCRFYSTHINETDITFGDTERLRRAVEYIGAREKPRLIFLSPSAVPEVIGTDLPALCRELRREYPGTPLIPLECGGFDTSPGRAVGETLSLLVKNLPLEGERGERPSFNLIGSCADLFRFKADAGEVLRIMEGAFGMKPLCVLSSGASVEQIEGMGGAWVNLVIRREGEEAAKHLQERFGTPYVSARPYGTRATVEWIRRLGETLGTAPKEDFIAAEVEESETRSGRFLPTLSYLLKKHPDALRLSLGGHADIVEGIMKFGCGDLSFPRGTCWCDDPGMADPDIPCLSEEGWVKALGKQKGGLLMASGEVLAWAGRNREMQISNPDLRWRVNPYEPPFIGFRGALNLLDLWINEAMANTPRD
jgi:nitrogenase molybdenum-iron protein alpha/beta subunit